MKLKIFAIVALAAVGVGAAFVAVGGLPASAASTTQYLTGAATTGDVADDVAATGTVAHQRLVRAGVRDSCPPRRRDGRRRLDDMDRDGPQGRRSVTRSRRATSSPRGHDRSRAPARRREHRVDTAKIQLRLAKASLTDANDARHRTDPPGEGRRQQRDVAARRRTKTRDDVKTQIRLATLTAPIDGVVTAVNVVKGLEAPSGDAIVVDATTFQVTADVVESDLAS